MGGRGASMGMIHRVPNAAGAFIHDSKITNYCLNPEKPHYKEFTDVGYSRDDPGKLKNDLYNGLQTHIAEEFKDTTPGAIRYHVDMRLGVGQKKLFRTSWRVDPGSTTPRFITAFRIKENRK